MTIINFFTFLILFLHTISSAYGDDFWGIDLFHKEFSSRAGNEVITVDMKSFLYWQHGRKFPLKNMMLVSVQVLAKGNGHNNFLSLSVNDTSGPWQQVVADSGDFGHNSPSTYRSYYFASPQVDANRWMLLVKGSIRIHRILLTVRPSAPGDLTPPEDVLRYHILGVGTGGRFAPTTGSFTPVPCNPMTLKIRSLISDRELIIPEIAVVTSQGKKIILTTQQIVLHPQQEKEFDIPQDYLIANINVMAKLPSIFGPHQNHYQIEVGYGQLD